VNATELCEFPWRVYLLHYSWHWKHLLVRLSRQWRQYRLHHQRLCLSHLVLHKSIFLVLVCEFCISQLARLDVSLALTNFWLIERPINWLFVWLINLLIDWLIDLFIYWVNRSVGWVLSWVNICRNFLVIFCCSDVTIRLYRFRWISIRFFDQLFDLDSI